MRGTVNFILSAITGFLALVNVIIFNSDPVNDFMAVFAAFACGVCLVRGLDS
jgi:hypothetical protein